MTNGGAAGSSVAIGYNALPFVTGSNNTVVGASAGTQLTSGASNLLLGPSVSSTTLTTGSNNILIGTSNAVDTPAAATSNFLNIGNIIFATGMTGTLSSPAGSVWYRDKDPRVQTRSNWRYPRLGQRNPLTPQPSLPTCGGRRTSSSPARSLERSAA